MTTNWPFPGDVPLVRARKCLWAYRAALEKVAPDAVAELDDRLARQWGERWITGTVAYAPDDWLSSHEAAVILGISPGRVSWLRRNGRIKGVLEGGKRFKYKVSDVYKLSSELRRRTGNAPDTVIANGPGAPTDGDVSSDNPQQVSANGHKPPPCTLPHPGMTCEQWNAKVESISL